jgi:hypothetical protein
MTTALLLVASALLAADDPKPPSAKSAERLFALHLAESERWQMFLDAAHKTQARLNTKPIYIWTNPTRNDGQNGAVFVWTAAGRPVVVGSIFSHPEGGKRVICHEFHSLAEGTLEPRRTVADEQWQPKAAVPLLPLPEAPPVESSPARRLVQMRTLSREFTAHSIDYRKERWELRLLPQPLYRYEKPEKDVLDGALFAYVTSAGTDPEVILVLEARKGTDKPAWHYRAIRFSDSDLFVQHSGKEVWSSVRDEKNQLHFNPDHTYRLIRDKFIDELPELTNEEGK